MGAIIIGVLIAGSFVAYALRTRPERKRLLEPAQRGVSCTALQDALEALNEGSRINALADVKEARRKAIEALESGTMRFGKPERFALQVDLYDLRPKADASAQKRVREKLRAAQEACKSLAS